jgi:hypothetical protein
MTILLTTMDYLGHGVGMHAPPQTFVYYHYRGLAASSQTTTYLKGNLTIRCRLANAYPERLLGFFD